MGETTAPIQSADLSGIVERLEMAAGPDRGLDAEISAVLEPHLFDAPGFTPIRPIPNFRYDPSENFIRFEGGGLMDVRFFPPVTASIDAATALAGRVMPGCELEMTNLYSVARVTLHHKDGTFYGSSEINSLPIAICIAAVKARALQSKGEA